MNFARSVPSPLRRALLALPLIALLPGCQEGGGLSAANIAVVSAPDVPVTILAVDGLPEAVNGPMLEALSAAAAERSIALVEADAKPKYQIKGYFAAGPGENGTDLSYVWEVMDTGGSTTERVEGVATAPNRPADPWAVLDVETQKALAGQSMNALAAYIARSGGEGDAAPAE